MRCASRQTGGAQGASVTCPAPAPPTATCAAEKLNIHSYRGGRVGKWKTYKHNTFLHQSQNYQGWEGDKKICVSQEGWIGPNASTKVSEQPSTEQNKIWHRNTIREGWPMTPDENNDVRVEVHQVRQIIQICTKLGQMMHRISMDRVLMFFMITFLISIWYLIHIFVRIYMYTTTWYGSTLLSMPATVQRCA